MQAINGNDMTQEDYDDIYSRITELQLLEIDGEDHAEELKNLKAKIEYEEI